MTAPKSIQKLLDKVVKVLRENNEKLLEIEIMLRTLLRALGIPKVKHGR